MVPESCLKAFKKQRVNAIELRKIMDDQLFVPTVHIQDSPIAGKGVFAGRTYLKGEFIGIYTGRLTKQFLLNEDVVDHYCQLKNIPEDHFSGEVYVKWYERNGEVHFLKKTDSHVLWSGIALENSDVEIGIDGLDGGCALAYINHSGQPNVRPLVTCPAHLAEIHGTNLSIQKSNYTAEDIMILMIATQPIKKGDELLMRYAPDDEINFEYLGCDIFPAPEHYLNIQNDTVTYIPYPTELPTYSGDKGVLDYEKELSSESKSLLEKCAENDPPSIKELDNKLLEEDCEETLKMKVVLCLHHWDLTLNETLHTPLLQRFFSTNLDLREFLFDHFSKSDAISLLGIKSLDAYPDIDMTEGETQRKESYGLYRLIQEGKCDTETGIKRILFNRIYRHSSNKEQATHMHIFQQVSEALTNYIPEEEWMSPAQLFQFAIDQKVFINDADRYKTYSFILFKVVFIVDRPTYKKNRNKGST